MTELSTSASLQDENSIIPGVFYFRIETRTGDDSETKCRKWVTFQENNDISLIAATFLPRCPCSIFHASFDGRFFGSFFDRFSTNRCFYSSFPIFINENLFSGFLFQKCCYSGFGALVVDGAGAGSPTFLGNTLPDEVLDDLAAEQACCYDTPNCGNFHSVRPPRDCTGYFPFIRGK